MTTILVLARAHPEVATLLVYLAALGAHVGVGILLHAVRIRDFDWAKVGQFIEADLFTAQAAVMLTTFLLTLLTTIEPNSDWKAAFTPAFVTLVASAGASTLPIVRDTLRELVQLVGGVPVAKPSPAKVAP